MKKLLETAYLSKTQWNKWNSNLINLNLIEFECSSGSKFGPNINEYRIYYNGSSIKEFRSIKKKIKEIWQGFPNFLSKNFK
jgi:hypothetical protein